MHLRGRRMSPMRRLPWGLRQPPRIRLPLKVEGPESRHTEHRKAEPGELPPIDAIRRELAGRRPAPAVRILPTMGDKGNER